MDEIAEHAWIISIVAFGRWDNEPLKNALLKQSSDARTGLVCVAVGTGFQIVSKFIEELFS